MSSSDPPPVVALVGARSPMWWATWPLVRLRVDASRIEIGPVFVPRRWRTRVLRRDVVRVWRVGGGIWFQTRSGRLLLRIHPMSDLVPALAALGYPIGDDEVSWRQIRSGDLPVA